MLVWTVISDKQLSITLPIVLKSKVSAEVTEGIHQWTIKAQKPTVAQATEVFWSNQELCSFHWYILSSLVLYVWP